MGCQRINHKKVDTLKNSLEKALSETIEQLCQITTATTEYHGLDDGDHQ